MSTFSSLPWRGVQVECDFTDEREKEKEKEIHKDYSEDILQQFKKHVAQIFLTADEFDQV